MQSELREDVFDFAGPSHSSRQRDAHAHIRQVLQIVRNRGHIVVHRGKSSVYAVTTSTRAFDEFYAVAIAEESAEPSDSLVLQVSPEAREVIFAFPQAAAETPDYDPGSGELVPSEDW